jgi:hypothetical protein
MRSLMLMLPATAGAEPSWVLWATTLAKPQAVGWYAPDPHPCGPIPARVRGPCRVHPGTVPCVARRQRSDRAVPLYPRHHRPAWAETMTDLKIATAVMAVAGIVVTFIDRWFAPRPRWLGWLAWLRRLSSGAPVHRSRLPSNAGAMIATTCA